ncbi:MAG: alpha/beta hydrolase [Candidatus Eremiobacteraeota bacterium]|nr:alpha/beta hydrolase [Candidatus Eremiobacteraeota bacterium]
MHSRLATFAAVAFCTLVPVGAVSATLPAAPTPAESFDVGMLHVDRYGSGSDAVILIPGLSCGAWSWNGVIPHLAAQHTVYALTLAGFAGLPPQGDPSFAGFARDLTALLDARHLARPALVGHSLGGTLAIAYAEDNARRLRSVVAVDGLPVFPGMHTLSQAERTASADRIAATMQAQTPPQFAAYQRQYMMMVVSDPQLGAQVGDLAAKSDPATVTAWARADFAADFRPGLSRIDVPLTEITGYSAIEGNPAAPVHYTQAEKETLYTALLAGTPHASVVVIPNARHFVMLDQPDAFTAALDAALTRS